MKNHFIFLMILLLLYLTCSFCFCDSPNLVPRRIYIENKIKLKSAGDTLLSAVPDMLFSLITSIEPVIQVQDKESAHTIITALSEKKDNKEIELTIQLHENGKEIKSSQFIYEKDNLRFNKLYDFLESTAEYFAGDLGPVEPETVMIDLIQDEATKRDFSEIEFTRSLSFLFELSVWSSILYKTTGIKGDTDVMKLYVVAPFPLWLDFSWKFDRNQAVYFSLYMDYNTYQFFDTDHSDDQREINRSENFSLYSGIGYMFKPPGRFSAGFSVSCYLGGINIKAVDPISCEPDGLTLAPGESEWVMNTFFSLQLISSYNISRYFSIHARTGLYIGLFSLFRGILGAEQYYEPYSTSGGVEILSVGVSCRF
jgi:hypothetical protein